MKHYEVAAAIITRKRENKQIEVFCAKRPNKGETALKWEFPGGKIESGESATDALKREIIEEFDTSIAVESFFVTTEHQYKTFSITLHSYLCTIIKGSLTPKEHIETCWHPIPYLADIDWAEADIPVALAMMEKHN